MRLRLQLIGFGVALGLTAQPAAGSDLKDLYFGEALYHAYQGQFFDALQRLDTELAQHHRLDEPALDSLHHHIGEAEFSVGDFELNYRMHHRAGRAIQAVLEGAVDEAVRNEAAYRLARIHFQKGQLDDALHALARIEGDVPASIQDDVEFLRANLYLATGRHNLELTLPPRAGLDSLTLRPRASAPADYLRLAGLSPATTAPTVAELDRLLKLMAAIGNPR
jgi:tetratricopeptide (TPR) repeat protein